MKIRTDFVTNSSSSSFCITLRIIDKNDNAYDYCYNKDDALNNEDYYTEYFYKSLKELKNSSKRYDYVLEYEVEGCQKRNELVKKLHIGSFVELKKRRHIDIFYNGEYIGYIFEYGTNNNLKKLYDDYASGKCKCIVSYINRPNGDDLDLYPIDVTVSMYYPEKEKEEFSIFGEKSVKELCELLTNNIYSSNYEFLKYDCGDEDELDYFNSVVKSERDKYINKVTENISDLRDVKKIIFERDFFGWGEGCEMLADNDIDLVELAKKVVGSEGEEKEKYKKEMLEYIKEVNLADNGAAFGEFGSGFSDIRYVIYEENKFDIESLAQRLCSDQGPSSTSGYEYSEYDVETGEITENALFSLE